jgi:hypothetical protein
MICRRPRITFDPERFSITDEFLSGEFLIQDSSRFERVPFAFRHQLGTSKVTFDCPYPHGFLTVRDETGDWLIATKAGIWAHGLRSMANYVDLEVLYIGQAYGEQGERNATDRLMSHSTLQKIYAEAMSNSPDKEIWLLLWNFEPLMLASFDGITKSYGTTMEEDDEHIDRVLQEGITDQQQVNFTEAALIKYFSPAYNSIYKETFPSPAHSTYAECYDIDLNAVSVELNTEDLKCMLYSTTVPRKWIHYATFPLHSREERRSMFDVVL